MLDELYIDGDTKEKKEGRIGMSYLIKPLKLQQTMVKMTEDRKACSLYFTAFNKHNEPFECAFSSLPAQIVQDIA